MGESRGAGSNGLGGESVGETEEDVGGDVGDISALVGSLTWERWMLKVQVEEGRMLEAGKGRMLENVGTGY